MARANLLLCILAALIGSGFSTLVSAGLVQAEDSKTTRSAKDYAFSRVAETGDSFEKFGVFTDLSMPHINNAGQVIFIGDLSGSIVGEPFQGIFIYDGGTISMVQETLGNFHSFAGDVSINNNGTYSFVGITKPPKEVRGVYRAAGDSLTLIARNRVSFHGLGLFDNSIDDNGTIVFVAYDSGVKTIFTSTPGNNGVLTKIVDTNHPSFESLRAPVINAGGTVLFVGQKGDVSSINTSNGESITTIYDTNGALTRIIGRVAINATGVTSFLGVNDGVHGIFTGDGGPLTTFADSADFKCQLSSPNSINAANSVPFWEGRCAGGGENLFVGPDPVTDSVQRSGDFLAGKIVTGRGTGLQINDDGQIVFMAKLGGEIGIFIATPSN
jgi:hypothetical protein